MPGINYDDPAIEATSDGGVTWTTLSLPHAGGSSLGLVFPLSCRSQAGCIGVAATPRQESEVGQRVLISNHPATG